MHSGLFHFPFLWTRLVSSIAGFASDLYTYCMHICVCVCARDVCDSVSRRVLHIKCVPSLRYALLWMYVQVWSYMYIYVHVLCTTYMCVTYCSHVVSVDLCVCAWNGRDYLACSTRMMMHELTRILLFLFHSQNPLGKNQSTPCVKHFNTDSITARIPLLFYRFAIEFQLVLHVHRALLRNYLTP